EGAPDAEREVTIDHPRHPGWSVSSTTGAEERPDAWRWVVSVGAGERASLTVIERQPRLRRVVMMDMDLPTLAYWEGRAVDPQVRNLLGQLSQLRREIQDAET